MQLLKSRGQYFAQQTDVLTNFTLTIFSVKRILHKLPRNTRINSSFDSQYIFFDYEIEKNVFTQLHLSRDTVNIKIFLCVKYFPASVLSVLNCVLKLPKLRLKYLKKGISNYMIDRDPTSSKCFTPKLKNIENAEHYQRGGKVE